MNASPATSFEAVTDGFPTGSTVGVRIIDNAGTTTAARVTAGVTEYPAGSGIYQATLTAPTTPGTYTLVWDDGTSWDAERLDVNYTAPLAYPPSASFLTVAAGFATGLAGTIGVRVVDNVGATTVARATAGVTEVVAGSGVYQAIITTPAVAGQYTVVWDDGSVTPSDVAADDLTVSYDAASSPLPAATDLCTVADVRLAMEIPDADTSLDGTILDLIHVASEQVCGYAQRELANAGTATRKFSVFGQIVDLSPFDLQTITSVTLDPDGSPQTLTVHTDYEPLPVNTGRWGVYTELKLSRWLSIWTVKQMNFGHADVSIVGTWGFATVPEAARRATVTAVRSWLRKDVASYAQIDSDMRALQPQPYSTYKLPAASKALLDDAGLTRLPGGSSL